MNGKTPDLVALRKKTEQLRYNLIAMMDYAGSGHPGGSLSVLEIMTSLYYDGFLKVDAKNPQDPDRDRFVISKGHASPTQYVILADLGYYGKDKLRVFDKNNSMLPKHCNRKLTPGVDASTGALGQGMSMAVGMALAARADDAKYRTYCVLGDGECQSGEIWEAAMSASKYKLGNLKVIVDNNRLQIDGFSDDIMPLGDQRAKWSAFGWHVEVCDGHNLEELRNAFTKMEAVTDKPSVLIANTVKGNGVSFMENEADWHSRKMTHAEGAEALAEIAAAYEKMGFGEIESSIMFLDAQELAELTGKAWPAAAACSTSAKTSKRSASR